jgi:hypothetical protein
MKIRASLVLALLVICASAVQAQSTCCAMIVGPQNITRQSTLIAASQGSVWTYTSSATAITPIGCVNTSKSDAPCQSGVSPSPNVVGPVPGYGAWSPARGEFVACNPSFESTPSTQPTSPPAPGAKYVVTAQGYAETLDSSGNCVLASPQLSDESNCPAAACSTIISGGPELWIDGNHNDISQPEKLRKLASINSTSLRYTEDNSPRKPIASGRTNEFAIPGLLRRATLKWNHRGLPRLPLSRKVTHRLTYFAAVEMFH